MTWERTSHKLACGCSIALPWDDYDAGDELICDDHGVTTLVRKSRIRDDKGSRNYQLSILDEGDEYFMSPDDIDLARE